MCQTSGNHVSGDGGPSGPGGQSGASQKPGGYRYYVTGALTLAFTFNFLDRQILSILSEQIKAEFALSDTQLGLLMGWAFAIFYTFFGIGLARVADRTNRVNLISIAILFWSAMTALCAIAANYVQLFALRTMVGVGEAGLSPSAHSILSDYFRKEERGRALSIYSMGTVLGQLLALLVGGYVGHKYGWRVAFVVVGAPGLLIALLLKLTIREPARGGAEETPIKSTKPSLPVLAEIKALLSIPLYLYALIGHVLTAMFAYTLVAWIAPHYLRAFGLDESQAGPMVAGILLFGGLPGLLIGGFVTDRMAKVNMAWLTRLPALCVLAAFPIYLAALLSPNMWAATGLFALATFALQASFAPPMSAIQHAAPVHSRAMAAALVFFFSNAIGLGMGPLIVGIISDNNLIDFGPSSLASGLIVIALTLPLAAAALWRASTFLEREGVI